MLARPTVRLATLDDAPAIARFSRDYIEHGLAWSYTRERIVRAIQRNTTNVAVVDQRDALCGFGIMDYGDTAAHLVLLGVQVTERRRGIGRHILSWLEECAVTAGLLRIGVEARADNPQAIAFYQQQGYQVRTRIPGYYQDVLDGVRLEKSLRGYRNETGA
jgi:ribosomal protein S18 acetylase RimI-like enzyme